MKPDMLFKGCMRPPLLFGVPMMPFIIIAMPAVTLVLTVSFWFIPIFGLVYWAMVIKTKQDELYFDLLGMRMLTYFMTRSYHRTVSGEKLLLASTTARRSREVANEL
jgi:type IV secretory pathway VirB3-like protein